MFPPAFTVSHVYLVQATLVSDIEMLFRTSTEFRRYGQILEFDETYLPIHSYARECIL
jgi:hypothetical protein